MGLFTYDVSLELVAMPDASPAKAAFPVPANPEGKASIPVSQVS